MPSFGKSIRIYLADGTAAGIRHAELVNWTGQALLCPRSRLAELAAWPESQRPGVYLLFGDSDSGEPSAYIGEAENVLVRLQAHLKTKDFWSRVVFFTSKDDNLTKAHVKYLESRLHQLAREAKRVRLENGNVPQAPVLPRSERDTMEEFLESLSVLLGVLGFPIVQPVASTGPGPAPLRFQFRVAKRGIDATGAANDEGFVVFAGSRGDADLRGTMGKGYQTLRDDLLDDGRVVVEGSTIRFVEDVLFTSPSAAAAVLAGGAYNGREAWRTADGTTLKALEERLAIEEET
ncbi:MAG: GIY-YIG nuclease family protein [Myxococcales bacterium]|nr:GIY-YIG nuclease family protein [Myxococcales bacterium]